MRVKLLSLSAAISIALSGTAAAGHDGHNDHATNTMDQTTIISAAVAREDRPEAARVLDENRKPAETLEWLGLEPGMDVLDFASGRGYWTEIMAHVAGPDGSVSSHTSAQFFGGEEGQARWDALIERAPAAELTVFEFPKFVAAPNSFDFALTNLNYHDLYFESERLQIERGDPMDRLKIIYSAMRPGGIVGVIDHSGPEGDTRAIVEALHRIAPATVITDFEKAGFELVDQSDLLANPDDDHTLNVFNPEIRGKTDRFLLKFRKPAS